MANGVAVHRRVRRGGNGAAGDDVLGRHPAERGEDRRPLGAEHAGGLEDARQRLADGDHCAER